MITSTEVVLWLSYLRSNLKIKGIAKAQLTQKAIKRFYSLSTQGFFPELTLVRQYRSGLLHVARVR